MQRVILSVRLKAMLVRERRLRALAMTNHGLAAWVYWLAVAIVWVRTKALMGRADRLMLDIRRYEADLADLHRPTRRAMHRAATHHRKDPPHGLLPPESKGRHR